ncbi:hypothetical protein BGZ54_003644, partial [Gamsiella multidivaricata]
MPKVFSDHYFLHGLRLDRRYEFRVVYISDIDYQWVELNILCPYRSSYLHHILNALLYLRLSSLERRQQDITEHEQATVLERVSILNISMPSNSLNRPSHSLTLDQQYQREIARQKRVQCLVHGDDTNIDQDMWRLYHLCHEVRAEENNWINQYGHDRNLIRRAFPVNNPRLQLMLRSDGHYLRIRPDVELFSEYHEVPEGEASPPSPILSLMPPQYNSSGPEQASTSSSSPCLASSLLCLSQTPEDEDMMALDEACLRWSEQTQRQQEEEKPQLQQGQMGGAMVAELTEATTIT